MRGITPIISIIILLLIAVAIAGAGYAYLTSYYSGLTSSVLELTSVSCTGEGASIFLKNIGQSPITLLPGEQENIFSPDSETGILCHFEDEYCEDLSGAVAPFHSTGFTFPLLGRFDNGLSMPKEGAALIYNNPSNFDPEIGAIEFWFQIPSPEAGRKYYLFNTKGFKDLDQDGHKDLVVGDYPPLPAPSESIIYWGTGQAPPNYFSDSSPDKTILSTDYVRGVSIADLDNDNDGMLDLVFSNQGGNSFVYFASPDPNRDLIYKPGDKINIPTLGAQANSIADFDMDGDLDILFAQYNEPYSILYFNDGTGNFPDSELVGVGLKPPGTEGASVADVDNDGYLDILFSTQSYDPLYNFWPATISYGKIYQGKYIQAVDKTQNKGQIPAQTEIGNKIADLDNDGDLDLIFTEANVENVSIYYQQGDYNFIPVILKLTDIYTPAVGPFIPSVADVDNDGWMDIVASLSKKTKSIIFWGSPTGFGTGVNDYTELDVVKSVSNVVEDFDGNGWPDIFFRGSTALGSKIYYQTSEDFFVDNTLLTKATNLNRGAGEASTGTLPSANNAYGSHPSDYNNIEVYYLDGRIHFTVWDNYGEPHTISSKIDSTGLNQVIASWDETQGLKLYLPSEGSFSINPEVFDINPAQAGSYLHIGSNFENQGNADGIIDEFRVSNTERSLSTCSSSGSSFTCGKLGIEKEYGGSLSVDIENTEAIPGEILKLTDASCLGSCGYTVSIGGRTFKANVNC
jgi:hypothetical protein